MCEAEARDGGRTRRTGGVFKAARQAERRARTELCAETVDELHRGTAAPNALPEKSLDVSMMFVGRLRPRDKTLMGFSFGGGTSVKVSARSDAFARRASRRVVGVRDGPRRDRAGVRDASDAEH